LASGAAKWQAVPTNHDVILAKAGIASQQRSWSSIGFQSYVALDDRARRRKAIPAFAGMTTLMAWA